MKRLTYVKQKSRWNYGKNPTQYSSRETFQSVCDRLGKIEDILGDEYDLDRLRELAQADKEGRCVVLEDITVSDLQQMLSILDSTCYGDGIVLKEPTADVAEVMHAKWIKHEGYDECEVCHSKTIYGSNYCPNCGARMDKEDEHEAG